MGADTEHKTDSGATAINVAYGNNNRHLINIL
jgi:hypothetical protein